MPLTRSNDLTSGSPDSPAPALSWREDLDHPDVARRRQAALMIGGMETACVAIGERLRVEAHASVREALLGALTRTPCQAAVDVLLPLLRQEDAYLRNGAIEALASMPGQVGPRVDVLLADADPDVRIFAVNLLGELRHSQVPAWLRQVLSADPHVNVVAAALEVMAEVGGPEDLPAIAQAQARFQADPFIEFAADMARERIKTP